jgi:hypothetical protein
VGDAASVYDCAQSEGALSKHEAKRLTPVQSFPVGGTIPITVRLRPLAKIKVYRISVFLEEKVVYYAQNRRIQRSETVRRFPLLRVSHADESVPLLPILDDSPEAIRHSPLADWLINPTSSDDTTPSCLDPLGPWELESLVRVPGVESGIKFTTTNPKSNIAITHIVKVVLRVDRGDDEYMDAKGKRKKWDIIVEANTHLLHVSTCTHLQIKLTVLSATLRTDDTATILDRLAGRDSTCGVPCDAWTSLRTSSHASRRIGIRPRGRFGACTPSRCSSWPI